MTDEIRSDVGPWTLIPEWLLDAEISDRAVRLYAVLGRYADASGSGAYPSRRTLAKRLRCSTDTVDRATRELVDLGALVVEARFRENERTTNEYTLIRIDPSAPVRQGGRNGAGDPSRKGAATPSRTGAAENESPSDLEPIEREEHSVAAATGAEKAPRITLIDGRNLPFDALAEVCAVEVRGPRAREVATALNGSKNVVGIRDQVWREMNSREDGRLAIRDFGETGFEHNVADEIEYRAALYRQKMSGAMLTPLALAKWWSDLPGMKGGQASAQDVFDVAQREIEQARGQG